MIFILTISFLWGAFLTLFILSPLIKPNKTLISSHERNSATSPPENKELGYVPLKFIFLLLASFAIAWCVVICCHTAQANESGLSTTIPSDVVIPPPTILPESGYWLPSVNQYILIPMQGGVHIYYVGMFSNTFHAKDTKIFLPFPKNISDVRIHSDANTTIETGKRGNEIILKSPLKKDTNQIQAEFNLQANTDSVSWKKNSLSTLPGVTIIMMASKPAKILNFPKDFRALSGEETQFVRVGNVSSSFPEFNIVDIVPSRSFIYFLLLLFVCFFIAALFISIAKLKS